jgi:hypothetical protein
MNQHLKFAVLFAFMGAVTFISCFFGGGTTVSFYLFKGNIYMLPILATVFVVGLSVILYAILISLGPKLLDFFVAVSQEIWNGYRNAKAEAEANRAKRKKKESGG